MDAYNLLGECAVSISQSATWKVMIESLGTTEYKPFRPASYETGGEASYPMDVLMHRSICLNRRSVSSSFCCRRISHC